MSYSTLMSVRELIDAAFGEHNENKVNFKLVQTVLIILSKQLRLLQRRVEVDIDEIPFRTASTLSVTEVKLKAPKQQKKKYLAVGKDKAKTNNLDQKFYDKSKSTTESSSHKTKHYTNTSSMSLGGETRGRKCYSQDYYRILEEIEQERERELRVVNQRANSWEEAEKTPTPIASLDSMDVQYEKLLVVERVPTEDGQAEIERSIDKKAIQLSIVTQDQFNKIEKAVKELQKKLKTVGKADLPENVQLMQELRRGASLTDAMAALQLSARLDSAEKTLEKMISLVIELANEKGINIVLPDMTDEPKVKTPKKPSRKKYPKDSKNSFNQDQETSESRNIQYEAIEGPSEMINIDEGATQSQIDCVTKIELNEALQELQESFIKTVSGITSKVTSNAEEAFNITHKIEDKLNSVSYLSNRMNNLEVQISEYSEQINILDTGLSSQMTNYQEQLTQMQHDLEAGLESMAEALANTGGDTTAATELNQNFTNLQFGFDDLNIKQRELKESQDMLSTNIKCLWKEIEILVEIKSDREELADALRDKAGLDALNGLVTHQQFDAVRGDFEKQIGAAYDKFNNQELIWQKAIDDLLRELNEKADFIQLVLLRDDVNKHLEKLRGKLFEMLEIVGEPRAAALTRRIFHDTACISCSSPANMKLEENGLPTVPAFPSRQPTIYAKNTKPKQYGDHITCYPGNPIPHSIDPRSHYCHRYCGGSHTIIPTREIGDTTEENNQKPCPCYYSFNTETQPAKSNKDHSQRKNALDLLSKENSARSTESTPPLPLSNDDDYE